MLFLQALPSMTLSYFVLSSEFAHGNLINPQFHKAVRLDHNLLFVCFAIAIAMFETNRDVNAPAATAKLLKIILV